MDYYAWNSKKNEELIKQRGVSFERVIYHIEKQEVLDIIKHPNTAKYPNQRMFIINIDNYAYLIPFVETVLEDNTEIFLKTIIPSRKATRKYLEVNDEQ